MGTVISPLAVMGITASGSEDNGAMMSCFDMERETPDGSS